MSTLHDACPLLLQEINSASNCTKSYMAGFLAPGDEQPRQAQHASVARTTTATTTGNVLPFHMETRQHQESCGDGANPDSQQEHEQQQTTSACQTFVHLLKGYMGAGCLSLPWAISQLGFQWGTFAIFAISLWSSYNCWTIVKLKRFVMEQHEDDDNGDTEQRTEEFERSRATTYDSTTPSTLMDDDDDDEEEVSSHFMTATSITSTSNTKVTYPAVGAFFYGSTFETYVAACVCTQQLAICTVFISFVGENILAVLQQQQQEWNIPSFLATHAGVMMMELPILIGLSLIPNLKRLSSIMVTGTILLMVTFVAIGVIMLQVWPKDQDQKYVFPDWHHDFDSKSKDHHSVLEFQHWASAPLAMSAILYSYEGINLILPVESAMAQPQQFQITFVLAMMCVALILALFSIFCVLAFGNVTNGSITAFLIQEYPHDPNIAWWIMVANVSVSVSVLLTYPIQLFPALELLAPSFNKLRYGQAVGTSQDHDLSAFEPLPPLPEHDVPNYDDWHEEEEDGGQHYTSTSEPNPSTSNDRNQEETMSVTFSATVATSFYSMILPEMTMAGDSPVLRILLVLLTFFIAVIVPNVQSIISLAGALAGSSSALLIPPLLELAWIHHLESIRSGTSHRALAGQQEGDQGPPETTFSQPTERSQLLCAVTGEQGLTNARLAKSKCYILLLGGILFFVVGTLASSANIAQIYWNDN